MAGYATGWISDKMMNKIKLMLMLGMVLISLSYITADESFTFAQGQNFTLEIAMANADLSPCTACSCNISIFYPNGSAMVRNDAGTNIDGYCRYTTKTETLGTYGGEMYFTNGVDSGRVTFEFEVTPQGFKVTTGQGIIYALGALFVFGLFILSLYFAITIPWQDVRGYDGSILYIDYKKYLKFVMAFVAYITLMFFFFIGKGMSYAFLRSTELYGFFNVASTIMLVALAPVLIISSVFLIFSVLTDKKIMRAIERGIHVR